MQRDKPGAVNNSESLERKNKAADLEELDYPVNFSSVDGKARYSAPRVEFGVRLFNNYKHTHNPITLKLACAQGWHDALIERTEINATLIRNDDIPEHKKSDAKTTLLADLEMLSMHYWSVGNAHAFLILLEISHYYAKKKPKSGEENPFATEEILYRETAASYFYRAKLLAKESTSEYLAKILYHIADMDIELSKFQKWGNEKLLKKIDLARQLKLESDQNRLIDRLIHKNDK